MKLKNVVLDDQGSFGLVLDGKLTGVSDNTVGSVAHYHLNRVEMLLTLLENNEAYAVMEVGFSVLAEARRAIAYQVKRNHDLCGEIFTLENYRDTIADPFGTVYGAVFMPKEHPGFQRVVVDHQELLFYLGGE